MDTQKVRNPFEGSPCYYPVEMKIKILDSAVNCSMILPTNECPTNPEDVKLLNILEKGITVILRLYHDDKKAYTKYSTLNVDGKMLEIEKLLCQPTYDFSLEQKQLQNKKQ